MTKGGFGTILKRLRKDNNVSITMLSKETGIARSTIYRWENSDSGPKSVETLLLIAEFFGVPPAYFIQPGDSNIKGLTFEVRQLRDELAILQKYNTL